VRYIGVGFSPLPQPEVRAMTTRRLVAISVCLAVIASSALLLAGANKPAAGDEAELAAVTKKLKLLQEQRAATAQAAMEGARVCYEAETITLPDYLGAEDRLVAAELATASSPWDVVVIRKRHRDWAYRVEEKVRSLDRPGSHVPRDVYTLETAKAYALTAEIELLKAHLASKAK
jgi:hypothetical protein